MTDQELHERFERVATDIKAEGAATRRYFDVVAEGLRADIRVLADGHAALHDDMAGVKAGQERLEARQERLEIRQLALEHGQGARPATEKRLEERQGTLEERQGKLEERQEGLSTASWRSSTVRERWSPKSDCWWHGCRSIRIGRARARTRSTSSATTAIRVMRTVPLQPPSELVRLSRAAISRSGSSPSPIAGSPEERAVDPGIAGARARRWRGTSRFERGTVRCSPGMSRARRIL